VANPAAFVRTKGKTIMKTYLVSLLAGLLVGFIYNFINVKSPAPPAIALIGLLGMLGGEHIIPMARTLLGLATN
jgi:XapX domain-containing protein